MNILLEIFLWTGGGCYDYNIGRFFVKSGHSKFSCPECLHPGCLQRRMLRSFLRISDSQFPGPRNVGRMRMGGGCYDYNIGRLDVFLPAPGIPGSHTTKCLDPGWLRHWTPRFVSLDSQIRSSQVPGI